MGQDLRSFLDAWERAHPDDVVRASTHVSPAYEMSVLAYKLEQAGRTPVLVCDKTDTLGGGPSPYPVVTNLFASRARCAAALGIHPRRVAIEYAAKEQARRAPVVVPASRAPVKEVVRRGTEIDLLAFPVVTHHEMDAGPYITAGLVTTKDPETGVYNLALQRAQVKGPARTGLWMSPASHNAVITRKYWARDVRMPVAIAIGHHPAAVLGAQSRVAIDVGEYTVMGGLLGEPLELVASETWGEEFLVPARAEIVIEGEVPPNYREVEAPFGEFTRYYGAQRYVPVIEVTAVTHRRDARYLDILVSHADNLVMGGFALEAKAYQAVKEVVPGVRNVYLPLSGCCRFHCYIQIRKGVEGEGKRALFAALPSSQTVKHLIVVDDDVDIFDEAEVLWAVATRTQWDKDVVICPGMVGPELDPSIDEGVTTKAVIDATKPAAPTPFEKRVDFPPEVLERIVPETLLGPEVLSRLKPDAW